MKKKRLIVIFNVFWLASLAFSQSYTIGDKYQSICKGLRLRDAQENGKIIYSLGLYEPVTLLTVSTRKSTIDSITAPWLEVRTEAGLTGWCFGGYISNDSPDKVNMQAFLRLDQETNQLYSFYTIAGKEERFFDEKVILAYQGKEIQNIMTMILLNDGETLVFTSQKGSLGEIYSYNYKTGAIKLIDSSPDISSQFPSFSSDQFSGSSRFLYIKGIDSYVYDCKTETTYSFDYHNAGYKVALYGDYLYGFLTNDSGYPAYRADSGAEGPNDSDYTLIKYTENKPVGGSFYDYSDDHILSRKVTAQLFNRYLLIEEKKEDTGYIHSLLDIRDGSINRYSPAEELGLRDIWISDRNKAYTWHNGTTGFHISPDGTWGAFQSDTQAVLLIGYYATDFQTHTVGRYILPYTDIGPEPRLQRQKTWLFDDTIYQFFGYEEGGPRHFDCYMIRNGEFFHFLLDKGADGSRKDYQFFPIMY